MKDKTKIEFVHDPDALSYEEICDSTLNKKYDEIIERFMLPTHPVALNTSVINLLHGAMIVSKEAGELMDIIYRHLFYGEELDVDGIEEEVGDILYGCATQMNVLHKGLGNAMRRNSKKLGERYPNGFTNADATARRDKKETETND